MESLKKRLKPEKECDKIKVGHSIGLFAFSFVPPNLDRACPTRKYRAFYMRRVANRRTADHDCNAEQKMCVPKGG